MPSTTNFGWTTPADTDLVKDGAAAIRTLGNGIDTSFLDLKGGTSGQVLAKNSNTDLDFVWVAQDDSNAIQNAIVDAKGDLISATAADTPARLAVGANGTVLKADSAEATGLKWAAPDMVLLSSTTFTSVASQAFDAQFSSTFVNYLVFITGTCTSSDTYTMQMRASGSTDSNSNYNQQRALFNNTTLTASRQLSAASWSIGLAGNTVYGIEIQFQDPQVARNTFYNCRFNGSADMTYTSGRFAATTQFDGFIITASAGNMSGQCFIYGVK